MADKATGSMSASVFQDEVKATMSGSSVYEPKDANDKWLFAEVSVSNSSGDLIADREYLNPQGAINQLKDSIGKIGIGFKDEIKLGEDKTGTFETGLTQFGGRFGKDTDGSDINDDGISHKLGKELKLKGKYETLSNGAVKVYAELG